MIQHPHHVLLTPDPRLSALIAAAGADLTPLPPSSRRGVRWFRRWDHGRPDGIMIDGTDLGFNMFTVSIGGQTFRCQTGVPFGDHFACAWATLARTPNGFELVCRPPAGQPA